MAYSLPPRLTWRESQVMRRIVEGKTDAEIGRELSISPATVATHALQARRALGVSTRAGAAAKYVNCILTDKGREQWRNHLYVVPRLAAVIPKLTPAEWRVFNYLVTHPDASNKNIATALGVSAETIRSQLHLIRKRCMANGGFTRALMVSSWHLLPPEQRRPSHARTERTA